MLQFRDIKQNSSVYILDKTNIAVKNGKITSASFPKMEFNPQNWSTANDDNLWN